MVNLNALTTKRPPPIFYYSNDIDRVLFNTDNTPNESVENIQVYPLRLPQNVFYILNPHSGTNAESAQGIFPEGWVENSRNTTINETRINEFPRHMLRNLVLMAGEDGVPVPIAGSYFTKLLSATPGVVEATSVVITGEQGEINELTITGNLNLSGTGDALTAINTFGKINEIDCGYFGSEAE